MSGLQRELDLLERSDPRVAKAAAKYRATVAELTDRAVVNIETVTEPDGLGRQRFTVTWWDEGCHLGPRWRGQVYFMRLDDFLAMPGNGLDGRRIRRRRRTEVQR